MVQLRRALGCWRLADRLQGHLLQEGRVQPPDTVVWVSRDHLILG